MAKISFKSEDGREFEILEGSHVSLRDSEGEEVFWGWESIPMIHADLGRMIEQGQEMMEQLERLMDSHPDIPVRY